MPCANVLLNLGHVVVNEFQRVTKRILEAKSKRQRLGRMPSVDKVQRMERLFEGVDHATANRVRCQTVEFVSGR